MEEELLLVGHFAGDVLLCFRKVRKGFHLDFFLECVVVELDEKDAEGCSSAVVVFLDETECMVVGSKNGYTFLSTYLR